MKIGVVWVPDVVDGPGARSPLARALDGHGHVVVSVPLPRDEQARRRASAVRLWGEAVADADVVVTTPGLARTLTGVVDTDRVIVVADAVDSDRLAAAPDRVSARAALDLPQSARLVALTSEGGWSDAVGTVTGALRAMPSWIAVVLTAPGPVPDSWWRSARRLQVETRVYDRTADDPVVATAACDVACVLSRAVPAAWSATPAGLRARACGLPVVDGGAFLWRAGGSGVPDDAVVERFAAAVLDVLADDDTLRAAARAAPRVRAAHGWARRAADVLDAVSRRRSVAVA